MPLLALAVIPLPAHRKISFRDVKRTGGKRIKVSFTTLNKEGKRKKVSFIARR